MNFLGLIDMLSGSVQGNQTSSVDASESSTFQTVTMATLATVYLVNKCYFNFKNDNLNKYEKLKSNLENKLYNYDLLLEKENPNEYKNLRKIMREIREYNSNPKNEPTTLIDAIEITEKQLKRLDDDYYRRTSP